MAMKNRSRPIFLNLSLLVFCFSLLSPALAIAPGTDDGYTINGRVKIPIFGRIDSLLYQQALEFAPPANLWADFVIVRLGDRSISYIGQNLYNLGEPIFTLWFADVIGLGAKGLLLPGKLSNVKVILNGGQRVTFLKPDGYFSFHNVPAGTHLIEVTAIGYFFSPVRVDVSARNPGKVQAALTENRRGLTELVLEPLREEQYYEIREPFNIMSLVKSPMGLMVGFMVIVMFIMPKLVENMDPEEMKRAQEEMRNQGVPSIANLLPGASRG